MKKIFFTFILITFICSCQPSIQEKAEAFAESHVKEFIDHASHYEPIETVVDSLFWNVSFDMEVRKQTRKLIQLKKEYAPIFKMYQEGMSQSGHKKNDQFSKELQELELKKTEMEKEMDSCKTIIREKYQQAEKSYFYGWSLLHRFRMTDEHGRKRETWAILLTDKEVKNIIYDEVIFEDSSIQTEVCNTILEVLNKETLLK